MDENYSLLDWLSILSIILQLQIMDEQRYQSDNDDIIEELQKQDKIYFEKIISNQEKIIKQLNILTDKVD